MSLLLGLRFRLRSLLRRGAADAETREELEFHVARQAEKHVAAGMDPAAARRRAVLELGGAQQAREATADARTGRWLEDLAGDTQYALRGFLARPGFTFSAILTLAIGVGSAATIGTVAHGALVQSLPFPEPHRLMAIPLRMPFDAAGTEIDMVWSYPKFEMFRDRQRAFESLALHSPETLTLLGSEGGERVSGEMASASYFAMLGARASRGRTYTADEDRPGGPHQVVVIADDYWRSRLGGREDVLGEHLTIGGVPHTIIGVMQPGFAGLSGDAQLWIPVPAARSEAARRSVGAHNMELLGRVAAGLTTAQAREATITLGRVINDAYPPEGLAWGATARELASVRVNPSLRRSLTLLTIAAGLLVLIVFANLTTLLLTRASAREQEFAVRVALGGGRTRLARQLATESVVLGVVAGALGLGGASFATRALAVMLPLSLPTTNDGTDLTRLTFGGIGLDGVAAASGFALALALAGVAGLIAGARIIAGSDIAALRVGGGSQGRSRRSPVSSRSALTALQVALGLVFLVASGVTLESLQRVLSVPLGYQPEGMLQVRVTLDPTRTATQPASTLWREITDRIERLPGVTRVALGDCSPIGMHCEGTSVTPVGHASANVTYLAASPGYFEAIGTRVLRGRAFAAGDTVAGGGVIVNAAAARLLWGGDDPLTVPIESQVSPTGTVPVIGVVDDARYGDVEQPAAPALYVMFYRSRGVIFVRANGDPASLVLPIQRAIRDAGAGHARGAVQVMTERLGDALVRNRLAAGVFAAFAAGALLLAAIGVYGTLALGVVQRSRELAIRRALGATGGAVMRAIGVETARIALAGLLLGTAAAAAVNRVLSAALYGVSGVELGVYGVSVAVLAAALLAAAVIPTVRSLRIDPREAMRSD